MIELDGSQHWNEMMRIEYDAERTKFFRGFGFNGGALLENYDVLGWRDER